MSIFKKIGQFFVGLFNAAKKTYSKLSPEQKAALQNGTGLISLINGMTEKTAQEIRAAIQKKFPNIPEPILETALFSVAKHFGLIVTSIDDAIEKIKNHLSQLQGKAWAIASHAAASVLSIVFSPPATKVAAIVSLIEFVYQHFIKKATS